MSHLSSNTSSTTIFYHSIFSVRYTLRIYDFIIRVSDFFSRTIAQGGKRATLAKQLKKVFHCYRTVFQKLDKSHEEINISF